ncbi:hypothetical protein L209DRAFT_748793 [Thermothelomyces heterothallicus CBS 203.75]
MLRRRSETAGEFAWGPVLSQNGPNRHRSRVRGLLACLFGIAVACNIVRNWPLVH